MTMRQSGKFRVSALAGLMAGLLCASALTAQAQDYCVATNGNDSWAGTSWAAPFLTIQKGIDSAAAGQTVAVSNGTYVLTAPLALNKGVTVTGIGGASNTVIDANYTGRVLAISDSAAVMDGFTLKNGKSATALNGTGVSMTGGTLRNCIVSCCTNTAAGVTVQGVGIYLSGGTVDTCVIEKNSGSPSGNNSILNGGGLCAAGASCLVTNCLISDNSIGHEYAKSKGGGVYLSAGKLLASVVKNNTVNQGRNVVGGGAGVFVTGAGAVSNCLVSGNAVTCVDALTRGGGVYVDWGWVVDCVVSNNSGQGYSPVNGTFGGGVYLTGTALVERCVITKNYQNNRWTAYRCGAGVASDGGVMRNCVIAGNTANTLGGGAYIAAGSLLGCVVTNNLLSAERAGLGGGGLCVTGSGVVSNCLVAGNLADCVDVATRGGGIYAQGGWVVDCVVSNNKSQAGWDLGRDTYGGGVYMTNMALVERCVITRNYQGSYGSSARKYGAGVGSDGGIMRSCLIAGNTANTLGGGVYITAGTNESCTITRNLCSGGNYGGVFWTNTPAILNAIVYNNSGALENDIAPVAGGVSGVTYSCAPSLTNGIGNITADPLFVDAGSGSGTTFTAGDYRTVIGGPCSGTGLVAGWMSTALDIAGLARLRGPLVDMGAYTAIPPLSTFVAESGDDANAGTSWSAPFRTIQKGINAATALATVSVSNGTYVLSSQLTLGKGCTVLGVNGSANTVIDANASGRIITIDHPSAVVEGFTLRNGKSATAINGTGVSMTGGLLRNCTVSGCTNNTQTYSATPIQGVGIFMTGGTVDTCTVEKNMGGNTGMTVNGGGIYVAGSGCIVTNCLISGNNIGTEYATSRGGGAYLAAGKLLASVVMSNTVNQGRYVGGGGGLFVTGSGTVSNCLVGVNAVTCVDTKTYGGGIYAEGGRVADCVVSNNSSQGYSAGNGTYGGGLYMAGTSLVERCVITKNYQNIGWTSSRYGAGVASDGGVMRSCLIMGNTANTAGGGLYIAGGTNENCTIVRNACVADPYNGFGAYGGVYWTNTPVIVNAIIWNNTSTYGESNVLAVVGGLSQVTYSCAPSLTSGTGNITADPKFTASGSGSGTTFTAGDYRLAAGTPCYNKGLTESWMSTAKDLDRLPRVKNTLVDMGAYERQAASGTMIRIL